MAKLYTENGEARTHLANQMPDIFADTSGLADLVDPRQAEYPLAKNIYQQVREQRRKLVTTNYILAELVALLTSSLRIPRPLIITALQRFRASPHIEVLFISADVEERAWQLPINRPDKDWSLVDCTSYVVMQQYGIVEALTTDHHFEQAGFIRLLR